MTVIAYSMSAPDGDGHFFEGAPSTSFCPECNSCIDQNFVPTNLKMKRKTYEVSCTYDNRMIVSQRFKDFCLQHSFEGTMFKLVNEKARLYLLESDREVSFDPERGQTRFENLCESCGQYESVVGAYPSFLRGITQPLRGGFYCSDLKFGSGREKSPILFVGIETKKLIEEALFKRTEFEEVVL